MSRKMQILVRRRPLAVLLAALLTSGSSLALAGDEERFVIVQLDRSEVAMDANQFAAALISDKGLAASLGNPVGARSYTGLPSLPTGAGLDLSDLSHPEVAIRSFVTLEFSSASGAAQFLASAASDARFVDATPAQDTQMVSSRANFTGEPLYSSQWGAVLAQLPYVTLNYTTGTAAIAPVDRGVETAHPDLVANLRSHLSYNAPSSPSLEYPLTAAIEEMPEGAGAYRGHGTHVSGILAAAINGVGVGGTCPTCSLSVLRNIYINHIPLMMSQAFTLGTQALNLSFRTNVTTSGCDAGSLPSTLSSVIAAAEARQVSIVAASGNGRRTRVDCPAEDPTDKVIAAGGLQNNGAGGVLWDEALYGTPGCAGPSPAAECGSNWGTGATNGNDVVAPARDVLSTISYTWNPTCSDASFGPPRYGNCTGTSMAAPFVVGTVGLMRSVNPLLSAAATKTVLKSTAVAIGDTRAGAGRVDVRNAVEATLGRVAGAVVPNRLTPLFALTSTDAAFNDTGESGSRDWLYTTSPQLAIGARLGQLYANGAYNFPPYAGTAAAPVYVNAVAGGIIKSPTAAGGEYHLYAPVIPESAKAIAYLFATERDPRNPAFPDLVPLYRLSGDGPALQEGCTGPAGYRQHVYSSALTGAGNGSVQQFEAQSTACPTNRTQRRFRLDRIEGFMFSRSSPQPAGTHGLYRVYNATQRSWALALDFELPSGSNPNPQYAGYSAPAGFGDGLLGYVYANHDPARGVLRDADNDGLIDAYETMLGLNPASANSDCDALSDLQEFPIDGVSGSDPMQGVPCVVDIDVSETMDAYGNLTITAANIGGAAAASVNVKISLFSLEGFSGITPALSDDCKELPSGEVQGRWVVYDCKFGTGPGHTGGIAAGATASRNVLVHDLWQAPATIQVGVELLVPLPDGNASNNTEAGTYQIGNM